MPGSDPFRTLSHEPDAVTLGTTYLELPWRPALDWVEAVRRNPASLALALADEPDEAILALAAGDLTAKALEAASFDLIERHTGMRWWVALKLVGGAADKGLLGELTLSGVDPSRVTFGQWCAATYRILTRNADAKERIKIDFDLDVPPPGYEDAWDDGNDFDALVTRARRQKQS
jgi:hypothetical protein